MSEDFGNFKVGSPDFKDSITGSNITKDMQECVGKVDVTTLTLTEKMQLLRSKVDSETVEKFKKAKDTLSKKEYTDAVKTEKALAPIIRGAIGELALSKVELYGVPFSLTYQDKSTVDEEKLAALLESKGLTDAILIKKVPDPAKLPQLIADSLLTPEEVNSCKIPNMIPVLKLVKPKKVTSGNDAEPVKVESAKVEQSERKGMF